MNANKQQIKKTQLTTAIGYDTDRIIFSKPEICNVPNSTLTYSRINIATRNKDGSYGDLIINTERIFSFGLKANKEFGKDHIADAPIVSYTLPMCLVSKDFPSENELDWIKSFNNIVEKCKKNLISIKMEIKKPNIASQLDNFNPLYYKKDKNGEKMADSTPILSPKLIVSKKNGLEIRTIFTDALTNKKVDPLTLIGKYGHVNAALKIEGIYIGSSIVCLQIKLYEAVFEVVNTNIVSLLSRPDSNAVVEEEEEDIAPLISKVAISDDDDDEKSDIETPPVSDHEDVDEEKEKIVSVEDEPKKKIIRKVVRKVVKK